MPDRPDVEVIRPPSTLAKAKVGEGPVEHDFAAIDRAEAAIAGSAGEFRKAALVELAAMDKALALLRAEPAGGQGALREIFRRALDLKGQGGSFGYVLITQIGDSLKAFTQGLEQVGKREVEIIAAHVDAMKAVIAADTRGDGGALGAEIVQSLARLSARG